MNPDTGEIKMFDSDYDIPYGWMPLNKGEVVQIKNCYFKLTGIDLQGQTICLKAISKKEAFEIDAKEAGLR